ncbi:sensor domain-containing diguanylate cyclase [Acuticoccus sp. M5D2P5]|uniref:sensor domain-containing diguanylate cyclase n=1 Tax=Acuticoccus kalidii TaxID=2910977 RepID=UPI001F353485|nr:sensor domain-containing diguanylate cyclase [Acuticoccus kalidii]MCF3933271.1 sensor domain-containing diguanylate cyclase [Acuticoccus kalidii]
MQAIKRLTKRLRGFHNRLSLRVQTALFTAALCFAAVMLAAAWSANVARQVAIEGSERELVQLAQSLAGRLDQHMFERYREVRNIVGLQPLRRIWASRPEEARSVLQELQKTVPDYAWIGLAAPDGLVKVATGGLLEGVSVAERPWFIDGLAGITVKDVHDAKLLDAYLRTSPDEAPFRFVDVAMPVQAPNGQRAGVVGAHLSWRWAQDLQASFLNRAGVADGTELLVLSRDGSVLIGPDDEERDQGVLVDLASGQGATVVEDATGSMIVALAPTVGEGEYPGLGWVVAAQRPRAVVEAPADALGRRIILVGSAIAMAAALLAFILAGRVTGPLTKLSHNLDLVGRTPELTMIERQDGSSEIVQLSSTIRSLLRRIGTAEAQREAAHVEVEDLRREVLAREQAVDEVARRLGGDLETMRVLAETDPLTGLLNRRAFLAAADKAVAEQRADDGMVAILLFDIDHFKRVNDTLGHPAGDEVIRRVGTALQSNMRSRDKVARFGGEEFVVMLVEIGPHETEALANRIRGDVAEIGFDAIAPQLAVTVSVGVALTIAADRDIEDTIQRADQALYEAKAGGRNQVAMAA